MANPIHRTNIVTKDKRSQRKVADSTTELDKTPLGRHSRQPVCSWSPRRPRAAEAFTPALHCAPLE